MSGGVDYERYTEAELLEVLRRIDPRRSGQNFHRLTAALEARGYVVTVTEYGSARAVLREDAPRRSFDAPVRFGAGGGPLTWMEPSRNDFRLVGSGRVQVDNATVWITGRRLGLLVGPFFTHTICLDRERIVNAETEANAVRFEYRENASTIRAMTLWLDSPGTAERLIQLLPTQRSPDFHAQLADAIRFEHQLLSRSPRVPVTTALVAANLLVFAAMWAAGAELFVPAGTIHITWGSNFGPYTTDGEWWRLFTSAFLHFGIVHLAFNMWALAAVGPLVERLYGSGAYLFIYAVACLAASLASTGWHPDMNSAGASGAIFGVYGALLAAMLRGRQTIPRGVVAPLRTSALVFTLYALAIGFLSKGIDNGAHLGGLAAGFLVGVMYPRAANAQKTAYGPKVIAAAVAAGSLVLAAGVVVSLRSAARLQGAGLFWQTQHWLARQEEVVSKRQTELWQQTRENKLTDEAFANAFESSVLPVWREAERRLRRIELPTDSPLASDLQYLRTFTGSRRSAYELCITGARAHDRETLGRCVKELARGNAVARDMKARRRSKSD